MLPDVPRGAWFDYSVNKPSFLSSAKSRFTGDVAFREGWALIKDGRNAGYRTSPVLLMAETFECVELSIMESLYG